MNIHKLKIIQVMSNGSINFCYKTCNNSKIFEIVEKDLKNFHFNMKMTGDIKNTQKKTSEYKKKYFIIK